MEGLSGLLTSVGEVFTFMFGQVETVFVRDCKSSGIIIYWYKFNWRNNCIY